MGLQPVPDDVVRRKDSARATNLRVAAKDECAHTSVRLFARLFPVSGKPKAKNATPTTELPRGNVTVLDAATIISLNSLVDTIIITWTISLAGIALIGDGIHRHRRLPKS